MVRKGEGEAAMPKRRARELGLDLPGTPGLHNAITDVPGVLVGFRTLLEGSDPLRPGEGPVRTGVTAILPRGRDPEPRPVWAGCFALNGNGEMTGTHWIEDGGYFVGPVCLTNTHSVGIVHHAAVRWMLQTYSGAWSEHHLWAMPVVAETYDGRLNDINGQHVTEAHAQSALDEAGDGPVAEGNVGGGTGMVCYEWKGGTGTASRSLEVGGLRGTVGVLVQANHGARPWFTVLGAPVGRRLTGDRLLGDDTEQGSIVVVIGTDLPMLPHQLRRLARRAALGIARHGTPGGNDSGDIFLAFSTANPIPLPQLAAAQLELRCLNDECFDPIYLAVVEATEEAVLNALLAAEDMETLRPPGAICRALDPDELLEVLAHHRRLLPGI
jgi:D-aminopeptidase